MSRKLVQESLIYGLSLINKALLPISKKTSMKARPTMDGSTQVAVYSVIWNVGAVNGSSITGACLGTLTTNQNAEEGVKEKQRAS